MAVKAIAYSYWRNIKRGTKVFEDIPTMIKPDVIEIAKEDVVSGEITVEEYESFIGEKYEV